MKFFIFALSLLISLPVFAANNGKVAVKVADKGCAKEITFEATPPAGFKVNKFGPWNFSTTPELKPIEETFEKELAVYKVKLDCPIKVKKISYKITAFYCDHEIKNCLREVYQDDVSW